MKLSLKSKLALSLSSIAAVLLISSIISVMEYSRMSRYVSGMIADDIKNISVAHKLSDEASTYNLAILAVIGDGTDAQMPDFDAMAFMQHCDSLRSAFSGDKELHLTDSVEYAYSAYMLTSLELPRVLTSDFIDSREWYFNRLQPRYNRLSSDIDALSDKMYLELVRHSVTFERGFYRSIIPGIVAVGVGLLLIGMLALFLAKYYTNPIYRMLNSLSAYRTMGKRYTCRFEGDDQLADLNEGIGEIAEENIQLRRRLLRKNES